MKKPFKFLKWHGKKAVVLLLLATLVFCTVGGTLAYIVTYSGSLSNVFSPAKMETEIIGNSVTNKSETPVFVRATVLFSYESETVDDTALMTSPVAGIDFAVTYNTSDWFLADDGYWYYKYELSYDESTTDLLSIDRVINTPEGYELSVEVLTSIIQSSPSESVQTTWHSVTVVDDGDGNLTLALR